MERYQPLFGPFHIMDGNIQAANFRGKACDAKLKLAFGKSGDLEIELIQWIEGECPQAEFTLAGREGMHHIRFRVEDCDLAVERAETIGFNRIWYKAMGTQIKFAYMERDNDPLIIEFLEMPASMG